MITPEQLYAATNCGLDIIALHYPEARDCARTNRPFKVRPDERTPSAHVKLIDGKRGKVWRLTDFGGEGRALDPINVHMDALNLTFYEAILDLAAIFNVTAGNIDRAVNRPDIRKASATADQLEKSCTWEFADDFTPEQCAVMGPRVTAETLRSLHWYPVKSVSHVRNREVVTKYANERYPIFMRECWFDGSDGKKDRFYKIYEPLNPDKQWRFSYQPADKKPQGYINGMMELVAAWRTMNEAEAKAYNADPSNEGRPYQDKKLPEAIICSGERDALCARSMGYHPLWFNSETYKVSEKEYSQIMRYVDKLYNIPDIDTTGRIKGAEMALRFIDVSTVWLPDKLSAMRDNRGHARKDLRDWMEIYRDKRDFRDLLKLATTARFWRTTHNEKTGAPRYTIDLVSLLGFLKLNGFYTLHDEHSPVTRWVRVNGNTIRLVTPKEIRAFVFGWATETAQDQELRNVILATTALSAVQLEALAEIDPDFGNCTKTSQLFYFPNYALEVTADAIVKRDARLNPTGRYVWAENVINHRADPLPSMFEITHPDGRTRSEDFDISIAAHRSNYFNYLINSSRVHWRRELEEALAGMTADDAARYRAAHKFDIAGPLLSPDEAAEQKQCLISKIFAIGYIMHGHKSPERAWAPFAMDNIVGENDQCNGRSGKSFMFLALAKLLRSVTLSGRNPRLLDNPFVFEQINKTTDMVLVDDCAEYLPVKSFYDSISSGMTINAKNVPSYNLAFEDAPKFAFTTNYVPKEFDPSSRQRMLYLVFSDYYHQRTEENDYLETRQISDDFGKALFTSDYSEDEWRADINFIMQCVKFYLSVATSNIKIEPRLDKIIFRKQLREMSENFKEWAEYYFCEGSENLDREIVRETAFEDYKRYSGCGKITMQKFTRSLKGFVYTCDWVAELNPDGLHNSGTRIIRRIENPVTHVRESKEMLYIRSTREAERLKNSPSPMPGNTDRPTPAPPGLPF